LVLISNYYNLLGIFVKKLPSHVMGLALITNAYLTVQLYYTCWWQQRYNNSNCRSRNIL